MEGRKKQTSGEHHHLFGGVCSAIFVSALIHILKMCSNDFRCFCLVAPCGYTYRINALTRNVQIKCVCVCVQLKGYDILSVRPHISTFLILVANVHSDRKSLEFCTRVLDMEWAASSTVYAVFVVCWYNASNTQSAHSVCKRTHNLRAFVRDMRNGSSFFLHF